MARTLIERARHEGESIKGSRFIATAGPARDEAEAKALLAEVTAQMPDATHHCAAWRIAKPSIERALDDGEPSGSAGRPILAQMSGREVVDACVVVTRYYGGTKLGVGGLVRAYGGAAAAVLDEATLVPRVDTQRLALRYEYADGPVVDHALAQCDVTPQPPKFAEDVTREVEVAVGEADALRDALRDATCGRIAISDPA